ncbi:glycosyltransferase family 4 protein [Pseudomonas sp. LPB0260]|uniref:glycosyltransferase family 4 protein n=1 Tax=Pseudomonas sp. LPB0260 TaxID=2614442 RepID=UPI0015C208CE|nr:glycosyltransferase family 4 protein [Pseudomonas sp. LPB0260]QLC73636.1 glycosyltransferase family 4 protein [Pseudomonas sp. LPB0260]QLC76410.1 glycosyltransferase family 4 protein [Pseudomonas sp. LPB0260]
MKIAVVYQYYQGHSSPGHSLVYELTQHLAANGHEVTVVSGETGYMRRDKPVLPWYRRLLRWEQDGAVQIIRTYTYSELHCSYLGRLFSFISFSLTAPFGLLKVSRPDVVLASSPPIFPMLSVWLVCKMRGIPMVFEVRDLWPESAVQMGILRNRPLIAVMSWMERLLYNKAERIVTLTHGIRDDIHARGWPAEKLEVITCGIDTQMLYPDVEAGAEIRRMYGWEGRNIVLYFGAMGEANNLDVIIDAAMCCQDRRTLFLLVGDGMRRSHVESRIAALNINNIQLLAPVSKDMARGFINAADLCLVTLQDIPLFKGAIPTKLLDYMACGRPVLCGIGGEAAEIVQAAHAGVIFSPGSGQQLSALVFELMSDEARRLDMGNRAVRYVQDNFDAVSSRAAMTVLLQKVVGAD